MTILPINSLSSTRLRQDTSFAQVTLEKVELEHLVKEFPQSHSKQYDGGSLAKIPVVLIGFSLELPLVSRSQGYCHVKMYGELQEGEDEDGVAPAGTRKGGSKHDEDHPGGGDGNVYFVGGRMARSGSCDEVSEVAAPGFVVSGPVVKADAEEDGESEVQYGEEIGGSMARGEVSGTEDSEVTGEKVGGQVFGGG